MEIKSSTYFNLTVILLNLITTMEKINLNICCSIQEITEKYGTLLTWNLNILNRA